ncbi:MULTISPECIES: hypothetical protein [Bacillus cereus group]|uniref:hypothetical protein n=1 Tax=Bacillus cereus group TaxID=86661 RepID=UPI001F5AED07|nr:MULTISPECIES: hypothetical protein [Bacillus cereus group]
MNKLREMAREAKIDSVLRSNKKSTAKDLLKCKWKWEGDELKDSLEMTAYEKAKEEYGLFQEELARMYEKENHLLEKMQILCPHKETHPIHDPFDTEEIQKEKCSECGKIISN